MSLGSLNRYLALAIYLRGGRRFSVYALTLFSFIFPAMLQLAQAAPPQLKINGAAIVNNSSGCTVRLRGVDIDGLQYGVNNGAAGGITATAAYAISNWKCNVIRLPLSQDRWFFYPVSYRALVDQIVNTCSQNNCYVILDLHWSGTSSTATAPTTGAGWGTASAQQEMPDANAATFWSNVATRYANNPAVMFDLYNEPYGVSASIWLNGGSAGAFTTPGMKSLFTTVRGTGAKNIVLAGGLAYCNDFSTILPNFALAETTGYGVLYDAHVYAGNANQTINASPATYPFFVGEFGPAASNPEDGGSFDNTFIPYLNTNNLSWTAWTLDTSGPPTLITNWNYTADPSHGVPVTTSLLGTANPACDTALGGPTYTPTPVPTQGNCFMLSNYSTSASYPSASCPSTLAFNSTDGKWFTFDWTTTSTSNGVQTSPSHSYVTCPATPTDACTVILSNAISGPGGETYSSFVSGGYDTNGTSPSPVTYAGFGLASELSSGYTNLNWVNNYSFYIRTSVAPVTLRFQASNPYIDQTAVTWNGTAYSGGGNGNQYGFNFVVNQANTWVLESMPAAGMEFQDWCGGTGACPPYNGSTTYTQSMALSQVISLQWETQDGPTTLGFWVNDVCLSGSSIPPTATPSMVCAASTNTPSSTPTKTLTATTTASPTMTRTNSPTSTQTPTVTNTPANTNTATSTTTKTATFTATSTASNTPTNSPTRTVTFTPTNTVGNTSTGTATSTPTSTPTFTRTNTPTNTVTNTSTSTATSTATKTATATATNTAQNSFTPTSTPTSTATKTATSTTTNTTTNSPTQTTTSTLTATATNTLANTGTPTSTATKTATLTATSSATNTATSSPTKTATQTPTATATNTLANTGTPTSTATNTATLTATSTITNTATASPTRTATSTPSATATNTLANTGTATSTATNTATSTATRTATNTTTPTATNTPSSTTTKTPTATPTNSATLSPTSTNSGTPTMTPTGTVPTATDSPTLTPSSTPTLTTTKTATSTATNTTTNTATSTATRTATNTATNTSTSSATSTATNSATSTATSTATVTTSNTPTGTPTNTLVNTGTPTNTATLSPTSTPSRTATSTATLTMTNSATSSVTSTPTLTTSNTPTGTPTNTLVNTGTPTNTATLSPTSTPSRTSTSTATLTTTNSVTSTATMTATVTTSNTPTSTPTNTLINTGTPTHTATLTPTSTPTLTMTSSATATATNTLVNTATPTNTPSSTPTEVTVAASQGSNPPGNSNQLSGATNVAVQQVLMTNTSLTSTINMTGLTLSVSGTGSPADITSVTLWANGVSITSTTFSGTTATFAFSGPLSPSAGVTYTVTANFGPNASGTYDFSVTGASGTNGQAAQFTGLPMAGATVTVSHATATPTTTPTLTPTMTPSFTPTAVTVAASQGSNPPGNSSQLSGASNVAVQQVLMTNTSLTSTINMTGLTLSVSGTGSPADITSVTLSANGVSITSTTFSGTTATFAFSGPLSPSAGVTYTVTANFGPNAGGTYTFSVTGASGTNGQAAQFTGLPMAGATVTVTHPTSTPTSSPTITITSTPGAAGTPVVFPNPSSGGPVTVAASFNQPVNQVDVQIFTTAFRKVQDTVATTGTSGVTTSSLSGTSASNWRIPIFMQDTWGNPLASGLYYVVITTNGHQRSIAKLLLLR